MIQLKSGPCLRTIVALNVAVFAMMTLLRAQEAFFAYGGFVPIMITAGEWFTLPVPPIVTPITSAFLHNGILHLVVNMLMLWVCGIKLEAALGPRYMALLYVVGALIAAAAQWAADTVSIVPMVGASGAVSAIVGAYAMIFSEQKVAAIGPIPGHIVRIAWLAAAWIVVQALFGFAFSSGGSGSIAVAAHIGGFAAGLVLARPLLRMRYRQR